LIELTALHHADIGLDPVVSAQQLGFIMVSVLFWVSAGKYDWLIRKNNIGVFQFLYFFSSFWGQFGPNCTTFLLAGAIPPEHCCHGPAHHATHIRASAGHEPIPSDSNSSVSAASAFSVATLAASLVWLRLDLGVPFTRCLHGLAEPARNLSQVPCIQLRLCFTAGELFPTEVRTTAHGFSAGVAKLGALWATIFFNYIGNKPRFW